MVILPPPHPGWPLISLSRKSSCVNCVFVWAAKICTCSEPYTFALKVLMFGMFSSESVDIWLALQVHKKLLQEWWAESQCLTGCEDVIGLHTINPACGAGSWNLAGVMLENGCENQLGIWAVSAPNANTAASHPEDGSDSPTQSYLYSFHVQTNDLPTKQKFSYFFKSYWVEVSLKLDNRSCFAHHSQMHFKSRAFFY